MHEICSRKSYVFNEKKKASVIASCFHELFDITKNLGEFAITPQLI